MGRLGAGVHAWFAIDDLAGKRINFFAANAAIAPFPSLAEIRAGINFTAVGTAEQRPTVCLENNRTEVFFRHRSSLRLPRAATFLERKNSVDGADEQLIFRDFALCQRLASGR